MDGWRRLFGLGKGKGRKSSRVGWVGWWEEKVFIGDLS